MPKKKTLFEQLRDTEGLLRAWDKIYNNGRISASKQTRAETQEFKKNDFQNIRQINRKLCAKTFTFDGAKGIAAQKPGKKKPRPITLAPLPVRIVQRRFLDILQGIPGIEKFLKVPTSFGAIKDKGVPEAIIHAAEAIRSGKTFFLKSDIASFFTQIPLKSVLATIKESTPDDLDFMIFLEKAINLEVSNINELEKKHGAEFGKFFVFDEVGVPQGCCLSPLLGNMLLYDFDQKMNEGDIICLRYLDDFLILGPSLKAVHAAFKRAQTLLQQYGLTAYNPQTDKTKASEGSCSGKFEFLGVEFCGNKIRPAPKTRDKLLGDIKAIFDESLSTDFAQVSNGAKEDASLVQTLLLVHNKVKGWGNQYYYCNDKPLMGSLDKQIDDLIRQYLNSYYSKRRALENNNAAMRRLLGVHLLTDSKSKPISLD